MKSFRIRIYLKSGGDTTVIVQAQTDYEARKIAQAQFGSNFDRVASSAEVR